MGVRDEPSRSRVLTPELSARVGVAAAVAVPVAAAFDDVELFACAPVVR